jgi:hypothetical protein
MKKSLAVLLCSFFMALVLIPGIYGMWQQELGVEGCVRIRAEKKVYDQSKIAETGSGKEERQENLESNGSVDGMRVSPEKKTENIADTGHIGDTENIGEPGSNVDKEATGTTAVQINTATSSTNETKETSNPNAVGNTSESNTNNISSANAGAGDDTK